MCFSDDGAVIKNEDGHVFAYYSPFRQSNGEEKKRDIMKHRIRKIFLLEKANKNRVLPLKKSELMDSILRHMIHFYKYLSDETACAGFYLIKEILDTLPANKLEFAQRGEVWNNIW